MININLILWWLKSRENIGAYTALLFLSTIPAILSPVIVGFLMEHVGYMMLFISGMVSFILALFFMLRVKENA